VGVTPIRKLLEVIGREFPLHLTFSTTVAVTQVAKAKKKIRMKDITLYLIGTISNMSAEISAFNI
jgi:hypothetical protein